MSNKALYILWAGLYILCAALGFIPSPEGIAANAMTLLSIAFFIPGAVLLYRGQRIPVRVISIVSLAATVIALILNIWSVYLEKIDGQILYTLLGLVSAPMFSARIWLLSLFLWACLLVASIFWKKKPN